MQDEYSQANQHAVRSTSYAPMNQSIRSLARVAHHAIAILTSERARITDPRVQDRADLNIDEMKRLVARSRCKDVIRVTRSDRTH